MLVSRSGRGVAALLVLCAASFVVVSTLLSESEGPLAYLPRSLLLPRRTAAVATFALDDEQAGAPTTDADLWSAERNETVDVYQSYLLDQLALDDLVDAGVNNDDGDDAEQQGDAQQRQEQGDAQPAPPGVSAVGAGWWAARAGDDASHVSCQTLPDGFSLCLYTNACFRLYDKQVGLARPTLHARLPRLRGREALWDDAGTRELAQPGWVSHVGAPTTLQAVAASVAAYNAHAPLGQLDFTFKDSPHLGMATTPLLVPHQYMKEGVARPVARWRYARRPGSAAAGAAAGKRRARKLPPAGADDPAAFTVWVRDLWVTSAVYAFRRQLWGTGASVTFPLLAALVANASLHLGLPPLEFLLVATELRPAVPADTLEERFGWNAGLLQVLLTAAAAAGDGISGGGAATAPLLPPRTGKQAFAAGAAAAGAAPPDPSSPSSYLTHPGGGAVVISQADDLPSLAVRVRLPDRPQRAGKGGSGGPPPPPPVTVCADRAVLLGHKPAFVGGAAEANALRMLLASQLGLRFPFPSGAENRKAPPPRVLVVDRGRTDRPLANAAAVLALVRGYGLPVTYLDGPALARLSFGEQARVFNEHAVVLAAHGAALANVVFMPPRSAVIEVFPRGVWKPTYSKIASAMGHTHLPVFSFVGGGRRHPNAPAVQLDDKDACTSMSYPRITRDVCFAWVRALPLHVPLPALETALVAALNLVSYQRVEHRGLSAATAAAAPRVAVAAAAAVAARHPPPPPPPPPPLVAVSEPMRHPQPPAAAVGEAGGLLGDADPDERAGDSLLAALANTGVRRRRGGGARARRPG